MLNAAGIFTALDSRTSEYKFAGLLQGMDYLTGLSGGNWMVGSSAVNNFATVPSLRANTWQLHKDLVTPGGVGDTLAYLDSIRSQVVQKEDAGFTTTITDYWGLALGRQLVSRQKGGVNTTWSGIRDVESFRNASMPFPIVVSDGRRIGEVLAESNATIYEFNAFEFGTWDRELRLFYPMEYLGTSMNNGKARNQTCVSGFDYAGFVMGTSSSLFNNIAAAIGSNVSGIEGAALRDIMAPILEGLIEGGDDIAEVRKEYMETLHKLETNSKVKKYPNPFQGYNPENNSVTDYSTLELVDGGEDSQNIPLWPLLQPERQVDVILAIDSSANTEYNWPNGSSLVHTYRRINNNASYIDTLSFPSVPGFDTFVELGLNQRPTFFGCDGRNHSGTGPPPPLIVYLPNTPFSYYTNTSTFQLRYKDAEIDGFVSNGREQVGQGDGGDDKGWSECLACAILQRARERSGDVIGYGDGRCRDCFQSYCWNGTVVGGSGGVYAPHLKNGSDVTYQQQEEMLKGDKLSGKY